jgi:hypothetical protein
MLKVGSWTTINEVMFAVVVNLFVRVKIDHVKYHACIII